MPVPGWWPGKLRPRSKVKPGAAAVSTASSPRKSVDLEHPSLSPTPRAREKAPSLDSRAARLSGGGGRCGGGVGAIPYKLPEPVAEPEPEPEALSLRSLYGEAADETAIDDEGFSSVSGSSEGSSDEAPDHHISRSMDPVGFATGGNTPSVTPKILNEDKQFISRSIPPDRLFFEGHVSCVREHNLHSDEPSTSEATTSRDRGLYDEVFIPRTRSLSPGPKSHYSAVNNVHSRDFWFSPRSQVKLLDGLRSPPHPLPLPPAAAACSSVPPSPTASSPLPPSPTACLQSQSQWRKGKLLGSGTFGQVYLGFNSENGQFCAIKEVQVIADDPHSKERLKQLNQEMDILRQPSHPNIVQYYGSEMTDEALSIYLEYVSGGSIHKLLREYGPFKEPVIHNYTGQILSGIAYLHGRNTVHRDIKGANILVGPNGEVKLADFGMAKHISSFAEIRSFKGSPYWMAPEVIMNSKGYSLSVDIWSLGCTIIEMATARPPWHQYEGVAAIFKIANSKDIPEIPVSFSPEGKSFLQLCLKRDPASRSSAAQLMDHPFVHDHPAVRAAKSATLRNAFSTPADVKHAMSNREVSSKRSITPLSDIARSVRDFTGFSTTVPSPRTSSSPIPVRTNMSLPVSPSSSPLRQIKQSNWSCFPSPPHTMVSPGATAYKTYNSSSYALNQAQRSPANSDPWQDAVPLKFKSPYGSPKRF